MTRLVGTDRTLNPNVRSFFAPASGYRPFSAKTAITLSSELWFRWSWIFWKAYSEGYTSHMHPWSKSQWIKAVFQSKDHHIVWSTPKIFFSSLSWFTTTLTSSPLQMCQHHQVCTTMCMCVSFSQIFFKGLSTQLDTPLDPSDDAKLDHSSGTGWPICKQVCPPW